MYSAAGLQLKNLDAAGLRAAFHMLAEHFPERIATVWMLDVSCVIESGCAWPCSLVIGTAICPQQSASRPARRTLHLLHACCCQPRCAPSVCLCVQAPAIFGGLWKVVSPFIDRWGHASMLCSATACLRSGRPLPPRNMPRTALATAALHCTAARRILRTLAEQGAALSRKKALVALWCSNTRKKIRFVSGRAGQEALLEVRWRASSACCTAVASQQPQVPCCTRAVQLLPAQLNNRLQRAGLPR